MSNWEVARFVGLAEKWELSGALEAAVSQIADRATIPPLLAVALLRRAHASCDSELARQVHVALRERVPVVHRYTYEIQALTLLQGAKDALLFIRRQKRGCRSPAEIPHLTLALREGGANALALRYVRLCHRKWPHSREILHALVTSLISSGQPHAALSVLRSQASRIPGIDLFGVQLNALTETGDLDACQALIARSGEAKRKTVAAARLQIATALEQLDEARAAARDMLSAPGQALHAAKHFNIKHQGALLNELALFKAAERDAAANGMPCTSLVQDHYYAARRVLIDWAGGSERRGSGHGAGAIPRNIFQYWDTAEIPVAVQEIMGSWQGIPGWNYARLDRRQAIGWLSQKLGLRYVKAFKLANHVAEECDFLRLCLLFVEGGIYADADDRLYGSIDAIVGSRLGALLFLEPFGAVLNNFLCAAPGHPIIARAMEMACAALLGRDNDSTWAKTGPGLLTRAAALHVVHNHRDAGGDTSILPRYLLRRHVYIHVAVPYKKTPKYWGDMDSPVSHAEHCALTIVANASAARTVQAS